MNKVSKINKILDVTFECTPQGTNSKLTLRKIVETIKSANNIDKAAISILESTNDTVNKALQNRVIEKLKAKFNNKNIQLNANTLNTILAKAIDESLKEQVSAKENEIFDKGSIEQKLEVIDSSWEMVNVEPDGNCFYHALGTAYYGEKTNIRVERIKNTIAERCKFLLNSFNGVREKLRNQILNFNKPSKGQTRPSFQSILIAIQVHISSEESVTTALEKIQKNGEWAEMHYAVFASLTLAKLGKPSTILCFYKDVNNVDCYQFYKVRMDNNGYAPDDYVIENLRGGLLSKFPQELIGEAQQAIKIIHTNHDHFQAVVSKAPTKKKPQTRI